MRRASGFYSIASLAALTLGLGIERARSPVAASHGVRSFKPSATSIAKANRWTGRPHEHRREIGHRRRQGGVA